MSELTIYAALRAAGMTAAGACGMMGNMAKESAMHSNNLQDSYNSMFKLSDEQYTALADAGKPTYNGKYFVNDEAGYGLCQWTHKDRKKKFLAFAKAECASISNEAMQVRYCIKELKTDFPGVWQLLCSTVSVYEAAEVVCTKFEMPAVNNVTERANKAMMYFSMYSTMDYTAVEVETEAPVSAPADPDGNAVDIELTNETVMHLQAILVTYGYKIGTQANATGIDGFIGKKTVAAAKDFVSRLEALV